MQQWEVRRMMYEYAPWAKDTLHRILALSSKSLPILDIQFGGACNLNCIYCDTPRYNSPCSLDLNSIEKFLKSGTIQWVYACGLGEPTAKGNVETFKQILAMCQKMSVKVSIFSNLLNLDTELLDYIENGTLHVLFKLDSFQPEVMQFLYGFESSQTMLRNYQRLKEAVRTSNGTTNLGASIVPTSKNKSELRRIIDWCIENKVYPLLGQLENAGKCAHIFEELKLSEEELLALREYMNTKYGIHYEIPVCPATISGVHITNTNYVIVDERTGLSCGWFWLDEPQMITIGNITDMTLADITTEIIAYRKAKFPSVVQIAKALEPNPFGGCGGDAKILLNQYIRLSDY